MRAIKSSDDRNVKLSFSQRIRLKIFGQVPIGQGKESASLYAFHCPEHGLQVEHPQGYSRLLVCPECVKHRLNMPTSLKNEISPSISTKLNDTNSSVKGALGKASKEKTGYLANHKMLIGFSVLGILTFLIGYNVLKSHAKK